jgi:hypothetical protein
VRRELPPAEASAAGYVDRLGVHDGGTQLVLDGWLPVSEGVLPAEFRIVAPVGGAVRSFRIRRRADVARAMGADHLYAGFSSVVQLGRALTAGEALPSVWVHTRREGWRPLNQDQTTVDWPGRFTSAGGG